jgi:hypothetical protein
MLRAAIYAAIMILTAPSAPVLADDYPPGPGTSGVIAAQGGRVAGVFDFAGDVDAFRVQLPLDGRAFRFLVTAPCRTKVVKIYNANFILLKQTRFIGTPIQEGFVEWRPRYAGLHYVTVTDLPNPPGYVCPETATNTYVMASGVSCLDWVGTACASVDNIVQAGTIAAIDDRNWYRFTVRPDHLRQGRHRMVSLYLIRGYTGVAPVLTIRRADGTWLTDTMQPPSDQNCTESHGLPCLWVPLCPGTYYVAVRDDAVTQPTPYGITRGGHAFYNPGSCP